MFFIGGCCYLLVYNFNGVERIVRYLQVVNGLVHKASAFKRNKSVVVGICYAECINGIDSGKCVGRIAVVQHKT